MKHLPKLASLLSLAVFALAFAAGCASDDQTEGSDEFQPDNTSGDIQADAERMANE